MVANCCYLEGGKIDGTRCPNLAAYEIWDPVDLNTHACADHIDALKSDNCTVHRFGVPGDCDTIFETPIGD